MKTLPDFSNIAQLAQLIQQSPETAHQLAEKAPDEFEQVLQLASFPLLRYQPFGDTLGDGNQCQLGIHRSPARNRWAVTGNRCGKTLGLCMEDVADCLGLDVVTKGPSNRFEPPIAVWIVSETEDASIEIVQRMVAHDILGPSDSYGWNLVHDGSHYSEKSGFSDNALLFANGSRIEFKYCSAQRSNKNAFAGRKVHKVHFDEEPYHEVYNECYARTIDYEGQLVGTMTPIYDRNHGLPWIFNELYVPRERKNIEFHNWSLFHNPHITENAKRMLLAEWDEDEIDARVYGMFTPVGIELAYARQMIRELRQACHAPKVGDLFLNERGEIHFDQKEAA